MTAAKQHFFFLDTTGPQIYEMMDIMIQAEELHKTKPDKISEWLGKGRKSYPEIMSY